MRPPASRIAYRWRAGRERGEEGAGTSEREVRRKENSNPGGARTTCIYVWGEKRVTSNQRVTSIWMSLCKQPTY